MKLILIAVLASLVFLTLFFLPARLIKTSKIVCRSQFGECEEYLLIKAVKAKGKNLSLARNYLKNFLAKELKIRNFTIRFQLPSTLLINVIARKAVMATTTDGSMYNLFDQEGVNLGNEKETRLPIAVVNESLSEDELERLVQIMTFLHANYQVNLGHVKGDSLEIDEIQGKKAIFSLLDSDPYVSLGGLKLILSRLITDSEMNRIRIIDLRFKNPVLK